MLNSIFILGTIVRNFGDLWRDLHGDGIYIRHIQWTLPKCRSSGPRSMPALREKTAFRENQ